MHDAPPDPSDIDVCSVCLHGEARYELRHDVVVCSRACEAKWAEQFCPDCGCNAAEGEMHGELCAEMYAADQAAE